MSALIFPKTRLNGDPLQAGDEYVGDNGVTYVYDGVKWVGHSQNLPPGTSSLVNNDQVVRLDVDGNFELPSFAFANSTGTVGQTLTWPSTGTVLTWTSVARSQLTNGAYTIELNSDGTIKFPNDTIDAGTGSIAVSSYVYSELAWHNNNIVGDPYETLDAYMGVDSSGTYIVNESTNSGGTGTNINVWYFDPSGVLRIGKAGLGPYDLVQNISTDIVDGNGNSLVYVVSTATAPTARLNGQLWFNSVEGRAYIKYEDVWVDLSPTVIPQPSTYLDELSISGTTISQTNTTGTEAVIINNNTSSWQFSAAGGLVFPDDTVQTTAWAGTSQLINGTWTFAVGSTGAVTLNGTPFVSGGGTASSDRLTTGSYSLVLGADGVLTFPNGDLQMGDSGGSSAIIAATDTTMVIVGQGIGGTVALEWFNDTTATDTAAAVILNNPFSSSTGTVQILTGEVTGPTTTNVWEFGADGGLTLPTVPWNYEARTFTGVDVYGEATLTFTVLGDNTFSNMKVEVGSGGYGADNQLLTVLGTTFPGGTTPANDIVFNATTFPVPDFPSEITTASVVTYVSGTPPARYDNIASTGSVGIGAGDEHWIFGTDGELTLPGGQQIGGSDSTRGIALTTDRGTVLFGNIPDNPITASSHFHIMKDGYNSAVDLFFGDDYNYVKLPTTQGVEIGANGSVWKFGTDGTLALPVDNSYGAISVISDTNGYINQTSVTVITSGTNYLGDSSYATDYPNTIVYIPSGPVSLINGNFVIQSTDVFDIGDVITIPAGIQGNTTATVEVVSILPKKWKFNSNGSLTFPDGSTSTTAWNTSTSVYTSQIVGGLPPVVTMTGLVAGSGGAGQLNAQFTVQSNSTVTDVGVLKIGVSGSNLSGVTTATASTGSFDITIIDGVDQGTTVVMAYATNAAGTAYSIPLTGTSSVLCLVRGTQVALSDGTSKPVEDITYDDLILAWDFDRGCYAEARPLWIKREEITDNYNLLTFSDGSTLRTVDQHRIFNKEAGAFTYPMTDDTPIGTTTYNQHGDEITLIKKEHVYDTVTYYNVITNHHMNVFADSILTSCRFNNIYPIVDMQFVKDGRILRSRSEFANIPDRFYTGLRLSEQTYTLDMIEWYVERLIHLEVNAVALAI